MRLSAAIWIMIAASAVQLSTSCTLTVRPVYLGWAGPTMSFQWGASLTCSDGRFGGLSGLALGDDGGGTLVSISDRGGTWVSMSSRPSTGSQAYLGYVGTGDAEAVTISPDRTASYVSIEGGGGVHRYSGILQYDNGWVGAISNYINSDCGWGNLQYESLELLDDHIIVGICESNGKGRVVDLNTGGLVSSFVYPAWGGLQPSDAARLSHGRGLLVLERKYVGGSYGRQMHVKVSHVPMWQLLSGYIVPQLLLELNVGQHEADNCAVKPPKRACLNSPCHPHHPSAYQPLPS